MFVCVDASVMRVCVSVCEGAFAGSCVGSGCLRACGCVWVPVCMFACVHVCVCV